MKSFRNYYGGLRPKGNEFKNLEVGFCPKSKKTFFKIRNEFGDDAVIYLRKSEVQDLIEDLMLIKTLHNK